MPDISLIQCLVFSAVIVAVDPAAVSKMQLDETRETAKFYVPRDD